MRFSVQDQMEISAAGDDYKTALKKDFGYVAKILPQLSTIDLVASDKMRLNMSVRRLVYVLILLISDAFRNVCNNKIESSVDRKTIEEQFASYDLQEIMSVSRILQKLKSSAQRRPLLFNSVIYGSFYTGAEFAQQTYGRIFKFSLSPISANIEKSDSFETEKSQFIWRRDLNDQFDSLHQDSLAQLKDYNWAQLKRFAIYGCFIAGPILHGWYKWLDTFYKGKTLKTVLLKLLVDQFILTPPLITMFFISMSLMEGKANVFDECKAKFVQTFKTSCMYWLPVQFLNFLLIPPALRVSFVSIAAFCWVNILCYLKNTPVFERNDDNQMKN